MSTNRHLASRVEQLEERLAAEQRAAIFAGRPDLPRALVKQLRRTPVAEVRAIVDAIPKPDGSPAAAALDAKMGIRSGLAPVEHDGTRLVLHTMTKAEAKAYAAARAGR